MTHWHQFPIKRHSCIPLIPLQIIVTTHCRRRRRYTNCQCNPVLVLSKFQLFVARLVNKLTRCHLDIRLKDPAKIQSLDPRIETSPLLRLFPYNVNQTDNSWESFECKCKDSSMWVANRTNLPAQKVQVLTRQASYFLQLFSMHDTQNTYSSENI